MKRQNLFLFNLLLLFNGGVNLNTSNFENKYIYHDDNALTTLNKLNSYESSWTQATSNIPFNQYYFRNLTKNLPNNYVGSCGYVACGMLLTYCDTYYNDDIVLDDYTIVSEGSSNNYSTSPGALYETQFSVNRKDYKGYYEELFEKYNGKSLQLKLFQTNINNIRTLNANGDYKYNFGFSEDTYSTLFENYFSDASIFVTPFDYTYERSDKDADATEVRNWIISYLKKNIPVLVGYNWTDSDGNNCGHVCIAYEYDNDNDIIYGHLGYYGKGNCHVNLDARLAEINGVYDDAHSLSFNTHKHSGNYYDESIDENICSCSLANHIHTNYEYVSATKLMHTYSCYCGITLTNEHNWQIKNGIKSYFCLECGAMKNGDLYIFQS